MSTDTKTLREALYRAAISCPHLIEADQIILMRDEKQDGKNALAQLADRLAAAISAQAQPVLQPLTDEQIVMIGRRAMDKCTGTEAQHIYIAREVERAFGQEGGAS